MRPALLTPLLFCACALGARDRVGAIDFFGYKGIDTATSKRPFHSEWAIHTFSERPKPRRVETVLRITGKAATAVGAVCCDDGDYHIFIGVAGRHPSRWL